jgi:hypothetical protein
LIENLDGQVIREVEIGQGSAHTVPAKVPLFLVFFHKTVLYALTLLGLHGFLFDLCIESLLCDDSAPE